jgi:hypothetical protein
LVIPALRCALAARRGWCSRAMEVGRKVERKIARAGRAVVCVVWGRRVVRLVQIVKIMQGSSAANEIVGANIR